MTKRSDLQMAGECIRHGRPELAHYLLTYRELCEHCGDFVATDTVPVLVRGQWNRETGTWNVWEDPTQIDRVCRRCREAVEDELNLQYEYEARR